MCLMLNSLHTSFSSWLLNERWLSEWIVSGFPKMLKTLECNAAMTVFAHMSLVAMSHWNLVNPSLTERIYDIPLDGGCMIPKKSMYIT